MEYIGTTYVEPSTGILDRFPLDSMYKTFKQGPFQPFFFFFSALLMHQKNLFATC